MIVQGGEVVDEWGDVGKKISSYSVRKSLISALCGIYSAEGVIDIHQSLEQLGIDDSPDSLTKEEKQARQPRSRNLLVLQQLGLQCCWNDLREKTRVENRRRLLSTHREAHWDAGFSAERCLLHGRTNFSPS